MPYFAIISLWTVLRLVSILASRAYGSISIVCGGGGIPPQLVHARTAETRPFLLLLFGPGNEARSRDSSFLFGTAHRYITSLCTSKFLAWLQF